MKNGEFHGLGRIVNTNGCYFDGEFVNGMRQGICSFTRFDRTYDIDLYENGNPIQRVKAAGSCNERWEMIPTNYLA
jgi:hypothetical protein